MLNGVMLIPFSMMVGSIFSSQLMDQMMSSTKITELDDDRNGLKRVLFGYIGDLAWV